MTEAAPGKPEKPSLEAGDTVRLSDSIPDEVRKALSGVIDPNERYEVVRTEKHSQGNDVAYIRPLHTLDNGKPISVKHLVKVSPN
ncbi:MAG: hypothetical protein JWN64_263 [Parcubacteria group bacterium]|nr:hypothetical protein [Parcubacteria group bacterium]